MRTPTYNVPITRGVYQAPWLGPNDELVLIAITRQLRLACDPVVVPNGASRIRAADDLWEMLDRDDPIPDLRVI